MPIYRPIFDEEAVAEMKAGVDRLTKSSSKTLGAQGRNAMYRKFGSPTITNDGVSINRMIQGENDYQDQTIEVVRQAAEKTNDEAGDGTTTSIVLSGAMFNAGLDEIEKGTNPMKLRKQMSEATAVVLDILKKEAKEISFDDEKELIRVATISVESKETGAIVADAVKQAGKNGIVKVEEAREPGIKIEKKNGLDIQSGYVSLWMITDATKMQANLKDVPILVTDKSFNNNHDLVPLMEQLAKNGNKEMLVICDDVAGELLQTIILTRMNLDPQTNQPRPGGFNCVVVKAPMASRKEFLADIAAITKSTPITQDSGVKNINIGYLGSAKEVIVRKDTTTIIDGAGDVEKYTKDLEGQIEEAKFDFEKDKLRERIAKILGSVIVIKVGAETEADMKYLKLKIDDAVNAVKAATAEGIIPGGGTMLYRIGMSMPVKNAGQRVIAEACKKPLLQILWNAGLDAEEWLPKLEASETSGVDVLTEKFIPDMVAHGIIDPVKVARCALKNANSVIGTLLTTYEIIGLVDEKE